MFRKIVTYGSNFKDFYSEQNKNVQNKIDYVFELIKTSDIIPNRFFQHLESTDALFEIRVEYEGNIYRIICFFDEGNLVVLINSFQKKSQKTPRKEIELAKNLKKQYFIDKEIDKANEKRKKVTK